MLGNKVHERSASRNYALLGYRPRSILGKWFRSTLDTRKHIYTTITILVKIITKQFLGTLSFVIIFVSITEVTRPADFFVMLLALVCPHLQEKMLRDLLCKVIVLYFFTKLVPPKHFFCNFLEFIGDNVVTESTREATVHLCCPHLQGHPDVSSSRVYPLQMPSQQLATKGRSDNHTAWSLAGGVWHL